MPVVVMPDKAMGSRPLTAPRILAWLELSRWGCWAFSTATAIVTAIVIALATAVTCRRNCSWGQ